MKKKLIEVSVDENGKYSFESEINVLNGDDPLDARTVAKFNNMLDPMIEGLFLEYQKGNMMLSRAIKFLTIADICADAQPYQHIENLWAMMMHNHLPRYEKKYRKMKELHGLKLDVVEPIRWVDPLFADMFGPLKS